MKKLFTLCAALLLGLSSVAAFAASVTGTWTGDMKSPDGSNGFSLTFTFTQDGDKLTGSVASQQGDPIAISAGKVTDDKITFDVSFNGTTIHHEGTVNGDEIKLTSKSDDGNFPTGEMTLKRSKPAQP
jgi:opacity protein-like surface antigen